MIVMASSRRLFPVLDSFNCSCMVLAGIIWLLMVLLGVLCFWSVLDGSGKFWPNLWINFPCAAIN